MSKVLERIISYLPNRKYKDRLFCLIFGSNEYKQYSLDLYNAVNGSRYTNPDDLEITTIQDIIYFKMKNDVSYLISGNLALYEHQSTVNPNMPLRGLMYHGQLYSQYIAEANLNLYKERLVKIPTPQYVVFYNGDQDIPDMQKLHLSDSFINPLDSGEFEWTATVYNIGHNHNAGLKNTCRSLEEYCIFVEKVQLYRYTMSLRDAINRAVDECIEEGVLVNILRKHKASVRMSVLTEFNEKNYRKAVADDIAEIIAEKDAALAEKDAENAAVLAEKDAALAEKDAENAAALAKKDAENAAVLAQKDAEIARLKELLGAANQ